MVMVGPSRSQQSQQLRCYSREPRLVVPRNRGAFAYDSSGSGDRGVSSGWSAVALRSRTSGGSETTGSARIDCSTASTLALSTVGALGITFFRGTLFGLTRLGAVLARRFFWIVLAAVRFALPPFVDLSDFACLRALARAFDFPFRTAGRFFR